MSYHLSPCANNPTARTSALQLVRPTRLRRIESDTDRILGFGNVHGVYKPGNVKLQPALLQKHQKYVQEKTGSKEEKPVFLVFHGLVPSA
jgi:fructose/tagatose bisphosphate aldolase